VGRRFYSDCSKAEDADEHSTHLTKYKSVQVKTEFQRIGAPFFLLSIRFSKESMGMGKASTGKADNKGMVGNNNQIQVPGPIVHQ
jgi:hypothetical protein